MPYGRGRRQVARARAALGRSASPDTGGAAAAAAGPLARGRLPAPRPAALARPAFRPARRSGLGGIAPAKDGDEQALRAGHPGHWVAQAWRPERRRAVPMTYRHYRPFRHGPIAPVRP